MEAASISLIVYHDTELLKKYSIQKKLSNGSFGTVFRVINKQTATKTALKVQLIQSKAKTTLKKQIQIMQMLENVEGVPKMYNGGKTEKLYFIELQLLDRDLSFFVNKNIAISIPYLCQLTIKMLNILESVHTKRILHRDLKPQNIMLQGDKIYLIDFGISDVYPQTSTKKRAFVGTPRYASIAAHKGSAQTPADEIQSLMYIIIFIFKRTLPWMDLNKKQNRMEAILDAKINSDKQQLCKGLPQCFYNVFQYLENKSKNQSLDYDYLRDQFIEYLRDAINYNPNNAKGNLMTVSQPGSKFIENSSRRRFSQMDPQLLGLLLKQRDIINGGKRQSVQTNFLTVPSCDQDVKSASFTTIELVTTEKAIASSSRQIQKSIQLSRQMQEHEDEQVTIQSKIRDYCVQRVTRGGKRHSTIKLFQFT